MEEAGKGGASQRHKSTTSRPRFEQPMGLGVIGPDWQNTDAVVQAGRSAVEHMLKSGMDRVIYEGGAVRVLTAADPDYWILPDQTDQN